MLLSKTLCTKKKKQKKRRMLIAMTLRQNVQHADCWDTGRFFEQAALVMQNDDSQLDYRISIQTIQSVKDEVRQGYSLL